ncbi:1-phosphofructokinase family hexose kinase [Mycolicibacterium palauense]|uniref:1-phosphofructokinase family hexose kinase n=1 Tax=Mycolicibacterium palauense TaxID=2034511 RepID=UPI001C3F20C3|nr:1-phosphofructokinase family hexose kinase [Mycolicibacterium palauense]
MIVTLTMNPALDITTEIGTVQPTHKMRCGTPQYDPGGGGINVARVARVLGAPVSAIFPAGGVTGEALSRLLGMAGIPADRIPIAEPTRESFTVNELSTGKQFRFILPGPVLTDAEQIECLDRLRHTVGVADYVVASGSLPPGVPADFYQRVADICAEFGTPLILDSSGDCLKYLDTAVLLLKPSLRELNEHCGRSLTTEADQIAAARSVIDAGHADNVVVSLGGRGALLVSAAEAVRFGVIPVQSRSGVGAGDAMVAGITVGLLRGWPLQKAVLLGTATGAATLLTPGTEVCDRDDVERLFGEAPEPVPVG